MADQRRKLDVRKNDHRLWSLLKLGVKVALGGAAITILFISYGTLPNRWYRSLYVYSGSMAPTIQAGDVIIISPPPAELRTGMIVTLRVDEYLVTHRVTELQPDGTFTTKGDANIQADEWGHAKVKLVGLYRARIPYLGYGLTAIKNLLKVEGSGAWFLDREKLKLQASLPVRKLSPTVTQTASVTPVMTPIPTIYKAPLTMTVQPTWTNAPGRLPTSTPSNELPTWTPLPTLPPTLEPEPATWTPVPTNVPTEEPITATWTPVPTGVPTEEPTLEPITATWTPVPTSIPTEEPTQEPSIEPTASEVPTLAATETEVIPTPGP